MTNAKYLFDNWITLNAPNSPTAIALSAQKEQSVDATLYAAKSISGVTSFDDLFKSDDSISIGLNNIANAMLPPNQYFIVTGISFQYAVAAGTSTTNVKEADYNTVLPAELLNGEISIASNKKPVLEKIAISKFDVADNYIAVGDTNAAAGTAVTYTLRAVGRVGYYELECPKMLKPQEQIEVKIKLTKAAATNAAVRIVLHGVTNVTN